MPARPLARPCNRHPQLNLQVENTRMQVRQSNGSLVPQHIIRLVAGAAELLLPSVARARQKIMWCFG